MRNPIKTREDQLLAAIDDYNNQMSDIYGSIPEWIHQQFPNFSIAEKIRLGFMEQQNNLTALFVKEVKDRQQGSNFVLYLIKKHGLDFMAEYWEFLRAEDVKNNQVPAPPYDTYRVAGKKADHPDNMWSKLKLAPKKPKTELEHLAEEAGILDGTMMNNDLDEQSYLSGLIDGVNDRAGKVTPKYLKDDAKGADSPSHSQYIEGYIDGYK